MSSTPWGQVDEVSCMEIWQKQKIGSIICQPGPKVWMTFEILYLVKPAKINSSFLVYEELNNQYPWGPTTKPRPVGRSLIEHKNDWRFFFWTVMYYW